MGMIAKIKRIPSTNVILNNNNLVLKANFGGKDE
jgi:hypothetical protein